ncbi:MAG TPA: hypothetical protein VGA39_03100 [Candidatus Acidoferrales bacterium]
MIPDGRLNGSSIPAVAVFWFSISTSQAVASYSVEANFPQGAATMPNLLVLAPSDVGPGPTCATGASSVVTRDTTALTPEAPNGQRFSFQKTTAGMATFLIRVSNPGGASEALTLRVAETTLFSSAWSTFGTFDTFYSFVNTTNAAIDLTLKLFNTTGTEVASVNLTVPANQTLSTNTGTLLVPRSQNGSALLRHNGPTGGLLVEAAIANFAVPPGVIQPVKFQELRAAGPSGAGGETAGGGGGGGDITAVNTAVGSGLQGGAAAGDVNLSLLTSCAAGQLLKWNGFAWNCEGDFSTGGTVTLVDSGAGLSGGPITFMGTLSVDFGGSGAATTVARSDHNHDATYVNVTGDTLTGNFDLEGALRAINDNATSFRLRGPSDLTGDDGVADSTSQSYAGIFYNAVFNDTGGTGAKNTRVIYGSNEDMDLEVQGSNHIRLTAIDNNVGNGRIRLAAEDQIQFHTYANPGGANAETDSLDMAISNGLVTVFGTVNATAFVGDGSGLTNVAAAGTANDLNCVGCVSVGELDFDTATQAELDTHKVSDDHAATYVNVTGDSLLGNFALTGNLDLAGTLRGINDNATSFRLRGPSDLTGDDGVADSTSQSYAGIFYNAVFNDTGGTGAKNTRVIYGSNEDMDLEVQGSNHIRLTAIDNNVGNGRIRLAAEDQIQFHTYANPGGANAETDSLDMTISDGLVDVQGTLRAIKDNATSFRLRGPCDTSGDGTADTDCQSFAGLFYNAVFDDTGGTGARTTRAIYGSNEDMDLEVQGSNHIRITAVDDNVGTGRVRIAAEDQIQFHTYSPPFGPGGTHAETDSLDMTITDGLVTVNGNLTVTGNVTKGGGAFKIDHPLDPANKYLSHSFVESPEMKNIYDGVVVLDEQGEAVVELPGWFEALNSELRYQLTCVGGYAPVFVAEEMRNNRFRIAGGRPGLKVSWQVTGTRQDPYARAHRIKVEEEKPEGLRGYYLHPDVYGQAAEKGISFAGRHNLKSATQNTSGGVDR